MTNPWSRGNCRINPYYVTAFRAAGIDRNVTAPAEVDQRIAERREAVKSAPGYYRLGDRALTLEDLTEAREILLDPARRIGEELLEHAPEALEVEELSRLAAGLPPPPGPEEPPRPRHMRFLLRVVQDVARQALASLPAADVPPAVPLSIIPPFDLCPEPDNGSDAV
jgi:hypothetical protein